MNEQSPLFPAPRTRLRGAVLLIGALAIAAIGGWRLWPRPVVSAAPQPPSHSFQPSAEQLKALGVTAVQPRSFRSLVRAEGTVGFDEESMTPVYSPYSGRVVRVAARLGDRVKRGQALFVVAAGEFTQGRSDVATARAALETARATERRQREMFDAGAASERDWQQAQSDRIAAEAAWNAARGRLRILGRSDREVDELERTPDGGPESPVGAPIDGTVTQRAVSEGQYIQSAAGGAGNPVFVIADLRHLWVLAFVRETDAGSVRVGQAVEIRVPALGDRSFHGRLEWVAAQLDATNHRLAARAVVDNPAGELKPQMFADLEIATSNPTSAPAVPEAAVVYDGSVRRVFVESGGTIRGREVRLGRSAEGYVEVLEGLHTGERIVTSATLFVDHTPAGD